VKLFGSARDTSLYELLEQQAEAAHRAAEAFHALTRDYANATEHAAKIDDIEHDADAVTHQLANKVDSTFVTPLDKEDIHALSTALDDITDAIQDATHTLALYQIPTLRADVEQMAWLLVQTVQAAQEAVACLRSKRGRESMQPLFRRVHDLEEQSDRVYRNAISEMYHATDRDPFMFIAWKEVYDRVEAAVDKCEDVANTVESVVVKYA